MASEKRIIGAVGVGDQTFTAGEEEAMEAHVKATGAKIDWDRLETKGVVSGYGKAKVEETEAAPPKVAPAAKKARKR